MNGFEARLRAAFGDERVAHDVPLAPLTTFKVGGPAEWLVTVRTADEIRSALQVAREFGIRVTPIGGGSNLLVADSGVRGLVLRIHGGEVGLVNQSTVRADAGVAINGLVRWTVTRGVAGLEEWAGTPGTVGGAIYGNAHFRGRLISELVEAVELMAPNGSITRTPSGEMEFGYDYSRLHRTREVVISADFRIGPGVPERLRETARRSLAFRKDTQPLALASAGCIFQNPDQTRDAVPEGVPCSAGALIDRAGLKGASEGAARVSPRHANFIVNEGGATAADIARLVDRCRREVRQRFGVELRDEIVRIGFDEGAYVHSEG